MGDDDFIEPLLMIRLTRPFDTDNIMAAINFLEIHKGKLTGDRADEWDVVLKNCTNETVSRRFETASCLVSLLSVDEKSDECKDALRKQSLRNDNVTRSSIVGSLVNLVNSNNDVASIISELAGPDSSAGRCTWQQLCRCVFKVGWQYARVGVL